MPRTDPIPATRSLALRMAREGKAMSEKQALGVMVVDGNETANASVRIAESMERIETKLDDLVTAINDLTAVTAGGSPL